MKLILNLVFKLFIALITPISYTEQNVDWWTFYSSLTDLYTIFRFKNTNEQFIRVMQLQDRIQEEFDRVVIQNPNFSAINADLTNNLKIILEKHIDK